MTMVDCVVGVKMTLYANYSEEDTLLVAVDSAASATSSSGVVHIMKHSSRRLLSSLELMSLLL
jgi:hypothetical protein